MDVLSQHEIAEAGHRILNPFTDEKLALLGELCRWRRGQRLLDLGSGKGEMLCTWARRHGIQGVGVDLSEVFVPAARARAAELGVADRVAFERAEASTFEAGPGSFDAVACIGATWIGGGLAGTVDLMRPALAPGGLLLIGEPFWREEPPAVAHADLALGRRSSRPCPGPWTALRRLAWSCWRWSWPMGTAGTGTWPRSGGPWPGGWTNTLITRTRPRCAAILTAPGDHT
jgi:SAM-dependent methyltransferase